MYLKVFLSLPVSVLEYFALSPWYDKTCLTSMFHARASLFGEKMDPSILKKMEGLDYELAHHQQNRLFVIDKVDTAWLYLPTKKLQK
jgi:hypothetical protein